MHKRLSESKTFFKIKNYDSIITHVCELSINDSNFRAYKHLWSNFPKEDINKTHTKRDPEFHPSLFLINIRFGNDLSSREATLRVLSAREVFTTVFGMGTGGVLLLCHR